MWVIVRKAKSRDKIFALRTRRCPMMYYAKQITPDYDAAVYAAVQPENAQ